MVAGGAKSFPIFYFIFFKVSPSKCYQIETKTYIKILRHTSLQMGLKNISYNFQACKSYDKRDIHVQNKFMENKYFHVLSIFQHQPFSLLYH